MGAANQHVCVAQWSQWAETQFQWPRLGSKFYCSCTCYGERLFSCPSRTYTFSCVLLSYKTSVKHIVFWLESQRAECQKPTLPAHSNKSQQQLFPHQWDSCAQDSEADHPVIFCSISKWGQDGDHQNSQGGTAISVSSPAFSTFSPSQKGLMLAPF